MKPNKIKIGVLSDSHYQTKLHQEAIEHLLSRGATHLLHAGDLEREEHLQMLENTKLPYIAVYGNNDTSLMFLRHKYNIYKEPHYFKIQELTIKMMHMPYYMNPDADIVISGHTHQFEATLKGETLFLNPGEVCAREKPLSECAMIEIEDGKFTVEHYYRELSKKEWVLHPIDLLA